MSVCSYIQSRAEDLVLWNLRGKAVPLDKLVPILVRRVLDQHFDAKAYMACSPVMVQALAEYLGISDRSVRDRVKEMSLEYVNRRGVVTRADPAK